MNLDSMERAYIRWHLDTGAYEILERLPEGTSVTAGELDNEYAICDISHWTQADLEDFDEHATDDQFEIIEALEFGEFARGLRGEG